MRKWFAIAALAIVLAACQDNYTMRSDSSTFANEWNVSVSQPALRVISKGGGLYESKDFSIHYSPNDGSPGWWLTTLVPAEGRMVCTNLLTLVTDINFDGAEYLIDSSLERGSSVQRGNLKVYVNNSAGGFTCEVDLVKDGS